MLVYWAQFYALVETKWQRDPISITQMQSFLWRLGSRGNLTMGIYISISGFHPHVISEAINQSKTIILLDKSDLEAIINDKIIISDLFFIKIWDLQSKRVLFWKDRSYKVDSELILHPNLISDDIRYFDQTGIEQPYMANLRKKENFGNMLLFSDSYIHHISDPQVITYTNPHDNVMNFNNFIKIYNNLFGFTKIGSFTFSQMKIEWHGFQFHNFVHSINNLPERYKARDIDKHHHHELSIYFDEIMSGDLHILISTQISTNYENNKFIPRFKYFDFYVISDEDTLTNENMKRLETVSTISNFSFTKSKWETQRFKHKFKTTEHVIDLVNYFTTGSNENLIVEKCCFINPFSEDPKLLDAIGKEFEVLKDHEYWIGHINPPLDEFPDEYRFLNNLFLDEITITKLSIQIGEVYLVKIIVSYPYDVPQID